MSGSLQVTCALISRDSKLLLARRADSGQWELPGGKQKSGESLEQCLAREIKEELGVAVAVGEKLGLEGFSSGGRAISLHCFACRVLRGSPRALEHLEIRWLEPEQALEMDLCPADRSLLERIEPPETSQAPSLT